MSNIIDLNKHNKEVIKIKIADKVFEITTIVNAVRFKYQDYITESLEQVAEHKKLKKNIDEYTQVISELKNEDEKNALVDELKKMFDELNNFIDESNKKIKKIIDDCLKIILEKNGYKYDSAWFDNETDDNGKINFIQICMDGKKKVNQTEGN